MRGPGLDPRSEANLEVPAYRGTETAPVIQAVMAPTQPGSKGPVYLGSEAACALKNGKRIPELEQRPRRCLRGASALGTSQCGKAYAVRGAQDT